LARVSAARLLGRLNEGEQQAARTDIEETLHHHRVVPGDAHHRLGGAAFGGAQMMRNIRQLVRGMLHIDEQPVEAGRRRHLGPGRAGERQPEADLRLAGGERALEAILWHLDRHQWISGSGTAASPARKSKSQPASA
jgi:hypothetical protein